MVTKLLATKEVSWSKTGLGLIGLKQSGQFSNVTVLIPAMDRIENAHIYCEFYYITLPVCTLSKAVNVVIVLC
jgi:hypothetical protein